MTSKFEYIELSSLISEKPRNGLYKKKEFQGKGHRWIKMSEVYGNDFLLAQQTELLDVTASEISRFNCQAGDLLFGRTSLTLDGIGDCLLVGDVDDVPIFESNLFRVRFDGSKAYPLFYFYFFKSAIGKQLIQTIAKQTAATSITSTDFVSLSVPYAPLDRQKEIGDFLFLFDKKCEFNTQTNQTLEQMAQAIFKSWLVDFDPVKAKINGEQPEGMDEATASLFPEKLVESELGLIPEGWEVSALSELIKLTGGGTPKRSEETYWNGDIPWFSVKDVPSGSNVFVVDTDEKITELGLSKSSTKLLPKGTTIITARGTVGKLALVGTDMCMNQSCYGIRGKEVGDYYNYFNLKQAVSTLQQNTHGAVFDTITTKTFDTYSLAFGGVELANKFDALIAPLLQKIEANVRQNIELSALRDTLLPKLLLGEIELETK